MTNDLPNTHTAMHGTLVGQLTAAQLSAQVLADAPHADLAGWKYLLGTVATLAAYDGIRVTWTAEPVALGPCGAPMPGAAAVTCQLPAGHAGQLHGSAAGSWSGAVPVSGWGR